MDTPQKKFLKLPLIIRLNLIKQVSNKYLFSSLSPETGPVDVLLFGNSVSNCWPLVLVVLLELK